MVFFSSGSQCWYLSHAPSSLFHHTKLTIVQFLKSEDAATVRSEIISCFTQYLLIKHWINNLLGYSFEGYKIGTVSDISFQTEFDLES